MNLLRENLVAVKWSRTTDAAASMFGDSRAFSLFQAFLQHPPCSPGSQLDFHEQ